MVNLGRFHGNLIYLRFTSDPLIQKLSGSLIAPKLKRLVLLSFFSVAILVSSIVKSPVLS